MKQHIGNAGIAMVSLFLVTYGAKIHSGKVAEMAEMAQASREAAEATTSEMVALRSPLAGRYLQMNKWGIAASVPATSVDNGWTFERWVKVNVADNFALHNTYWNRFLVMTDTGLTVSNFLAEDEHAKLPEGAWFENGPGLLGASSVYSQMFKRFLTMTSGGQVGVSDVKDIQEHVVPPNHHRTTNVPEEWTVQTQTFTRSDCPNLYHAKGSSCKANVIGKTIALWNHWHNRFALINRDGWMQSSQPGNTLWDSSTWKRFLVVDAGDWEIALHSAEHNRYVSMNGQFCLASQLMDEHELNNANADERFKLVDAGNGKVALHNKQHNRFMMMNSQNQIVVSAVMNWDALPANNHDWERFVIYESDYVATCPYLMFSKMASCKPWLIGQTVSFWNPWHKRYMQMVNSQSATLLVTPQMASPESLSESSEEERFRVVDIGSRWVGLYHEVYQRYVMMNDQNKLIAGPVSTIQAIPANNAWERILVVDVGDGKIALHFPWFNRFAMMTYSDMVASAIFNWNALPAGNAWERFTVQYNGEAFHPNQFDVHQGKMCKGEPYTRDQCELANCNGWSGVTQQDCQDKCHNNEKPVGCQQDFQCVAAVFEAPNWCQLYSTCTEFHVDSNAVSIVKKPSPFFLQMVDGDETCRGSNGTESERHPPEATLATALPLAIINLTNFSGLITTRNLSHMGMEHHFGNLGSDLQLLYDKVEGFYKALHEVMGEDAEVLCPRNNYIFIEHCLKIATCLLDPMVKAGQVPMAFYASMLEQLVNFEITWQGLVQALAEEGNVTIVTPVQHESSKYHCDLFDTADGTTLAVPITNTSLLSLRHQDKSLSHQEGQEGQEGQESQAFATAAALSHAVRATHELLDSLGDASGDAMGDWQTQNASMDFQRIKKQFQSQWDAMWLPVCRKMNCDHTNFWDIILSSYGQTMALMQTGPRAFAKVKAEIRNRAALQRRFQDRLAVHPVSLIQVWRRDDAQRSSLGSAEAYGHAGHLAVRGFLKKFAMKSPQRAMTLVDIVEFEKSKNQKNENEKNVQGLLPVPDNTSAAASSFLQSDRSDSIALWDFWKKLTACFGSFSKVYCQGYFMSWPAKISTSFGLAGGSSHGLEDLINKLQPSNFVSIWGAVSVGQSIAQFWAGISISFSVSMGCPNKGVEFSISIGAMVAAMIQWYNPLICPFGPTFFGNPFIPCFQASGGTFTVLCCAFNLVTGDNTCR